MSTVFEIVGWDYSGPFSVNDGKLVAISYSKKAGSHEPTFELLVDGSQDRVEALAKQIYESVINAATSKLIVYLRVQSATQELWLPHHPNHRSRSGWNDRNANGVCIGCGHLHSRTCGCGCTMYPVALER